MIKEAIAIKKARGIHYHSRGETGAPRLLTSLIERALADARSV